MIFLLTLLFSVYVLNGCSSTAIIQPSESEGCIIAKLDEYGVETQIPAFSSSDTIWFKANELITEINGIHFNTDTNGVQTVSKIFKYYAYVNYDSKQFSLYRSFSDTAQCIRRYPTLDSLNKVFVADFFGNSKKTLSFVVRTEVMSDTIVGDISFRRKRYFKKWKDKDYISIAYFRCDKLNSNFSLAKDTADSCSIVKLYDFDDKSSLSGLMQRDFIADTLTKKQLKVFEAWKRQAFLSSP